DQHRLVEKEMGDHGTTPSYRWRNEGILPGLSGCRMSRRLEGHDPTLHLCEIADHLARKGVHLQVLDQQVDTHTPTGRLLFGMLSVIAQFETELRAERQREGIDKAQRAGVHFGRTKALTPAQVDELRALRAEGVT